MTVQERYKYVLDYFSGSGRIAQSELVFSNPFELIVAVILSAQCTDKRVNIVTPALFNAYPDARSLAAATEEDVFDIIKSISYPNNKSRHLVGMAKKLTSDFRGEVPSSVEELMTLPGVGRKTANVVASIIYNEPVIAVDTHVFRVSRRLGLSRGTTPRAVELDLEKHIPEELCSTVHHWILLHGRYVCTAKKPQCENCGLRFCCKTGSKQ